MIPTERVPEPDEAAHPHFPDLALGADTRIVREEGRWVVYLGVSFWDPGNDEPLQCVWHRISDHPSEGRARVAARCVVRGAGRDLNHPPTGF